MSLPPNQLQTQTQVKNFLQSSAFPVLEPLKWVPAIKTFLESKKGKDENETKMIRLELVKQLELDLIHNITNGSIEDHWLITKSELNPNPKPHLVSEEIEKVAWEEYNEQQKLIAAQKQQQEQENAAEAEAPKQIVSPTKEREEQDAANNNKNNKNNKKKKSTPQIKKEEDWKAYHLDRQRDDALRPFRVQYEQAILAFINEVMAANLSSIELGNFCQYTTRHFNPPHRSREAEANDATRRLDSTTNDDDANNNNNNNTSSHNERMGNIMHWLYLPHYSMDQDEDLIIDVWACLRELRHIALEFPDEDIQLKKEVVVFETLGHQIRDSFCGHMMQLVDKPWPFIYESTIAAFGHLVDPVYRTQKIIEHLRREKYRKKGEEEKYLKTLQELRDAAGGHVGNYDFCKTLIKVFNKCDPDRFANSTLKSEKYAVASSTATTATVVDDTNNNNNPEAQENVVENNNKEYKNLTPSAIAEIERQQKELEEQENASKYSPKNKGCEKEQEEDKKSNASATSSHHTKTNDDDIHSATSHVTIASEMGKISRAEELKKIREMNYLTPDDVVDIVWCMGRCSGANKESIRKAIQDYPNGMIPPSRDSSKPNTEKIPYFDVSGLFLGNPVVVFKDPTFGFMMRSSSLREDWCVVQ
jgi:hypothetical protein